MSDEGLGLSKWKVALAVGVSAAAVVGVSLLVYIAVKNSGSGGNSEHGEDHEVETEGGEAKSPTGASGSDKGKTSTGDSTKPNMSVFERALEIKKQGNEYYKQQKYEEAIKCYLEGISLCPVEKKEEIAKFHQNIAAVYDMMAGKAEDKSMKTSHMTSVLDHCTQALQLNPRYIKALIRRVKVHEALGKKKDALLDVSRVIILDESQSGVLGEAVARLLKDISQEQAATHFPKLGPLAPTKNLVKTFVESFIWQDDLSEARLRELWVAYKKLDKPSSQEQEQEQSLLHEDQDVQIDKSDNVFEGFSDDPFVRAAAMFREEQYHGILEVLSDAVTKGCPVFLGHALLLRGTLHTLWRENESALRDFEAVINMNGVSDQMVINALIKKASVYAGNSEMDKVKSCYDKCFVIDSQCPDALIHRARVNLENPEDPQILESILDDLQKALDKVPSSPYAAFSLATAFHRMASINHSMQHLQQATTKFEEASKKFPNFVDGMILHALYSQDMGKYDKAEELMSKALQIEPDNPTVHFTMGILSLVAEHNPDKAAACMRKAISLDNSCIQAYDTLASLEIQKGNSDQAMELYEKATQFSRSRMEMGQSMVAKEVISAQIQVCREYGISMSELSSRATATPFH